MTQYFNRSDHKPRRQAARANMPKAEVMLWSVLKGRKMLGCKFRRQYENLEGVWEAIARAVREQIEQIGPDVSRGRRAKRDGKRDLKSDATPLPPFLRG